MPILPKYKDVPHIQEKLQVLKNLIALDKSAIALSEAQELEVEFVLKLKDQVRRNEKTLEEVTGEKPCQ